MQISFYEYWANRALKKRAQSKSIRLQDLSMEGSRQEEERDVTPDKRSASTGGIHLAIRGMEYSKVNAEEQMGLSCSKTTFNRPIESRSNLDKPPTTTSQNNDELKSDTFAVKQSNISRNMTSNNGLPKIQERSIEATFDKLRQNYSYGSNK
mmetsp:Transcript_2581/g.3999  ORF Transcript_2581/g.3999 Transcript_2581/m.3999 type:complete len:152 (-) Transcript_2581:39-494(-)